MSEEEEPDEYVIKKEVADMDDPHKIYAKAPSKKEVMELFDHADSESR